MSYVTGLMDEVEFNRSREEAASHPVYGPYDTYEEAEAVARTLSTDPSEATVMEVHYKAPPDMRPHPKGCLCDDCYTALFARKPGETRREYRIRMGDVMEKLAEMVKGG